MTQEDKKLLVQDLCSRLPYGVYIEHTPTKITSRLSNIDVVHIYNSTNSVQEIKAGIIFFGDNYIDVTNFKPYLRPMSSMTEEESKEYRMFIDYSYNDFTSESTPCVYVDKIKNYINWLNACHFDYRGLIPKGLALVALEGMYN